MVPRSNDFIEIQSEEIPYPCCEGRWNRRTGLSNGNSEVFAKVEDLQSKYSSP